MLIVPFFYYIWYLIEWIVKGYKGISFEREAYEYQEYKDYFEWREMFAWIGFIKKEKENKL